MCISHGAAAPQVRARAAERLALLVPDALATLRRLLEGSTDERLQLAAAREVLRVGDSLRYSEAEGPVVTRADDDLRQREVERVIARARGAEIERGQARERYAL